MGGKHVLKHSIYNYILFLILLAVVFSFKQWKKLLLLVTSLVLSYFSAIMLVAYGNFIPKIEIIKFLIPAIILSLAFFTFLSFKNILKSKEKYVLSFTILFGFFNGLGSSVDVILNIKRYESEFFPILEATLGVGASVLITVLGLLTVTTLLKKIPKFDKKKWVFVTSAVVSCLSVFFIFKQVFY
ncbi:HupE/UreJ family protein [Polaribacter pectinis]|uniref:HupE/UreJ family protein n=1 Tax=Polaribacter pectinis TaxID=2738844 RepID=UPI0026773DD2|nr:HupE/UreJ family protein [Polaribacter pectinis]